ncbi:GNAT family N-acetyltransferase [Bailinhaonella thermotolerans]|uniref:GNAT family N-acetyltransferase n=1 Tax=Bailinhaonella thermotolerans TaxID=1070861 RepID=A0A3A4A5N0_9ACTN|nr:GNAT family N-acetyltransferase [Bailinhaonella thermotolerans]RJL20796.1 GNAT family N-acetyltransferase [Bailinhaonella thermotolerans]
MISVGGLEAEDRAEWERLFRGYIDFYERSEPDEMYDAAWRAFREGTRLHALGARVDGRLAGITHYLFHGSTSAPETEVCYLQDLFTAPEARGRGVARALITAVTERARERGCSRVYWNTHESNATARILYDKVADYRGFIRYQIEL